MSGGWVAGSFGNITNSAPNWYGAWAELGNAIDVEHTQVEECTQQDGRGFVERQEERANDRLLTTALRGWAASRPERASTRTNLDNKMALWLARKR